MARPDHKRLDDMREMCALITEIVARGRSAFDQDHVLVLAMERAFEVLGEAANGVSDQVRADYPTIPWVEVTRLRIRLAHHYHRTDQGILSKIAVDDVPSLIAALGPLDAPSE